jgi:hypothetical protein
VFRLRGRHNGAHIAAIMELIRNCKGVLVGLFIHCIS